jgi:Uma2 family endonuclease
LLRPEPLADGSAPEERVVHSGISWERYLAFDEKLGDDRPAPRLYYLDGELEIRSTSDEHERIKKWLGGFVEDYFLAEGIETMPRGQATIRLALKTAGAEPDESWCIHGEKKFPDLVLEIALTRGASTSWKSIGVSKYLRSGFGAATVLRYSCWGARAHTSPLLRAAYCPAWTSRC